MTFDLDIKVTGQSARSQKEIRVHQLPRSPTVAKMT